jgi:hypothetical protein
MTQKIHESISVISLYDSKLFKTFPKRILWKDKVYKVTKLGLHHTFRQGTKLIHVFNVATGGAFMRLHLDTTTMCWILEEVEENLVS